MWNLLVQNYIFIRISDIKSDILFVLGMELNHTYTRSVTFMTEIMVFQDTIKLWNFVLNTHNLQETVFWIFVCSFYCLFKRVPLKMYLWHTCVLWVFKNFVHFFGCKTKFHFYCMCYCQSASQVSYILRMILVILFQ